MIRPHRRSSLSSLGLLIAAMAAMAAPAQASRVPASISLALEACGCGSDREALSALRDRIAAAPDVTAARELALAEVQLASAATGRAQRLVPWSSELAAAQDRLLRYEQRVAIADTPALAAAEFSRLMRLELAQPRADTRCDYSTGEIIAIVLGFILGIIPGIILLILLC